MTGDLSAELTISRDLLLQRRRLAPVLLPRDIDRLATRLTSFIALARDLEDAVRLAGLGRDREAALTGMTVMRLPGRTLVFPPRDTA